jgi:hypothetical protein
MDAQGKHYILAQDEDMQRHLQTSDERKEQYELRQHYATMLLAKLEHFLDILSTSPHEPEVIQSYVRIVEILNTSLEKHFELENKCKNT